MSCVGWRTVWSWCIGRRTTASRPRSSIRSVTASRARSPSWRRARAMCSAATRKRRGHRPRPIALTAMPTSSVWLIRWALILCSFCWLKVKLLLSMKLQKEPFWPRYEIWPWPRLWWWLHCKDSFLIFYRHVYFRFFIFMHKQTFLAHKIFKVTVNSKLLMNAESYKYIWIDKLEDYLMICRNAYIWVDLYEILFFVPTKIVCAYPNVICCTQLWFNWL